MTYRTRVPGTAGKEVTCASRKAGQEAVEAVGTTLPFAGAGAPIVVGNRRRREASVFGTALAPPRDDADGSAKEADTRESSGD